MVIDSTDGLFPYEGILGLSPNIDDNKDQQFTLGTPIPLHLKTNGKIQNAIVSLDMHQDPKKESFIIFGGYDATKFRNKSDTTLQWFSVPIRNNRFAWTREVKNIFFGGKSFDDGYVNTGTFDSFEGGLHLPQAEWTKTFTEIS